MKKENLHSGHRARMRKDFNIKGFKNWHEHNVLEYMLQWCKPRVDTNETAHLLLNECGGFANVFKADKEQLTAIDGVGDNTAEYIHMLGEFVHYYNGVRFEANRRVLDGEGCFEYLLDLFDGKEREYCYMLCLNKRGELIHRDAISEGGFDGMSVDLSHIVRVAIRNDASDIILAHNHPSGVAKPSDADITTTRTIKSLLASIGINLLDHIVVADGKCVSMFGVFGK